VANSLKVEKGPFAARAQRINIGLIVVALVLLAQQFSYTVYVWGFRLLMVVVTLQVALGNINPDWDRRRTIRKILVLLLIIVVIFVFSIIVTPYLIELGKPKKNY
jgi:predicted PurR-regulated permease PerM